MFSGGNRKRKITEQVVPETSDVARPRSNLSSSRRQSFSVDRPPPANPFADADYPIPNFEEVYNLMRDVKRGLQVSDRRWRIITYPKCFVGSEAVQWITEHLSCDREKAVSIGQRLMEAGIIHHVTHSEPFADAYFFYRFQEDDDTNILNMKRVWDPSIPTREAVDVSKDLLTRLALLCEEHRKHILATQPTSPASTGPLSAINPLAAAVPTSATAPSPSTPRLSDPIPTTTSLSPMMRRAISTPPIGNNSSPVLLHAPFAANAGTASDDVDYSTLAKSERFRQYTLRAAELQRVQLVALNQDERIAFFVNIYNLLCLHAYVVYGTPNSVLRRYTFFRGLSYRVAGLDLTLDDIEHGILRGNKRPPMIKFLQQLRPSDPKCQHVITNRDGRIHFVISAGTRSDPPIRILDGDNVQEELHYASLEFLSVTVKVDLEKRSVALPRIFYWYAEDFPSPEKQLLLWVARYLPVAVSKTLVSLINKDGQNPTISYENFDWANAETRFNSSIVRRKRRKLERERSSLLPSTVADAADGLFTPNTSIAFRDAMDGLFSPILPANGIAPIISTDPLPSSSASLSNHTLPVDHQNSHASLVFATYPHMSAAGVSTAPNSLTPHSRMPHNESSQTPRADNHEPLARASGASQAADFTRSSDVSNNDS